MTCGGGRPMRSASSCARDFDRLTLLADSSQVQRTQAGGFDGIALFDNYVSPDIWRTHAQNCTARDLVFSFQVNPGFDSIVFPQTDPDTCYKPPAFAPGGGVYDWSRAADRAAAETASRSRIADSLQHDGQPADVAAAGQQPARVLPRLHQLVQRMARRPSVRAGEEPRRPDRCRARARLSQRRRGQLSSRHAARADSRSCSSSVIERHEQRS